MSDRTIDTKGMKCPLPTLRTHKALKEASSGDILEILATDPMAQRDIKALCEESGNDWLGCDEENGVATIRVRKV